MQTLKFKTNIKCAACIATVTPFLNSVGDLKKWEVDTMNPDKLLIAEGVSDNLGTQVVNALTEAESSDKVTVNCGAFPPLAVGV